MGLSLLYLNLLLCNGWIQRLGGHGSTGCQRRAHYALDPSAMASRGYGFSYLPAKRHDVGTVLALELRRH